MRVFYPKLDRTQVIALLRKRIPELQRHLALRQVVLFGSYAKGNYTVGSDIDLLVIYAGEVRDDAYALVKRTLRLPRLEPHVYSEQEYRQLRATIERMIAAGVPIYRENSECSGDKCKKQ